MSSNFAEKLEGKDCKRKKNEKRSYDDPASGKSYETKESITARIWLEKEHYEEVKLYILPRSCRVEQPIVLGKGLMSKLRPSKTSETASYSYSQPTNSPISLPYRNLTGSAGNAASTVPYSPQPGAGSYTYAITPDYSPATGDDQPYISPTGRASSWDADQQNPQSTGTSNYNLPAAENYSLYSNNSEAASTVHNIPQPALYTWQPSDTSTTSTASQVATESNY